VRWKQASPIGDVAEMVVRECRPEEFADCDVVFSGLDSDVAGDVGTLRFFTHIDIMSCHMKERERMID
jgi:hypothetical protein